MGRSVVESLVSVIKEVPNPSTSPALTQLLSTLPLKSATAGRAVAAASSSSGSVGGRGNGSSGGGYAFVSVGGSGGSAAAGGGASWQSLVAGAVKDGQPIPGHQITMMTVRQVLYVFCALGFPYLMSVLCVLGNSMYS